MEATEILARVKEGNDAPENWIILPLQRRKVATGIAGWIFGIFLGLGLFALIVPIVIPYNYQHGIGGAVFTTVLLGILLFIGLGSIWALFVDARRLSRAHEHIIVITPEDYVKQEGKTISHVPLVHIRHVTARGRARPDRTPPKENTVRQLSSPGENIAGFVFGRRFTQSGSQRRKAMRTPSSLAFIDSRTDREVIVVNDLAYGDPFTIAALLKSYTANVQQLV